MNDNPVVIKAENVGKKYVIKHNLKKGEKAEGKADNFAYRLFHPLTKQSKEDFWALKDIRFEIRQGERVGIIGRNGAGKSTLLKILSRITEPAEGRIELLGKVSAMLEVGTGFNPELTGRENIYLNGAILGMTKEEIDKKFKAIVDFSEIGKFIDTPAKRYSSGMYVRLAFSVASHLDPDILIIDEVLAVGDQRFRQKCLDRMKEISRSNKTILCVSHQMNVIRELCDRVIVLHSGRVVYDGNVEGGIKVYLNEEREINADFYDLSSVARAVVASGEARLLSFEILNNEERKLGLSDELRFHIKWKSETQAEKVKLRVIIRDEEDAAVGLALSPPLCDTKAGGEYSHTLVFDTNALFPGEYRASLALFVSDSSGKSTVFDHLTSVITFIKVEPRNFDKSIIYDNYYWGNVRFPDLRIY